jgi:multidrug efflux pump subunit AcrA (membrane-fusion protein)
MNKVRGAVVVAVALAVTGLMGWRWLGPTQAREDLPSAAVVRRDLSAAVVATGAIRPQVGAEVKVGSRVSGLLRKLHFNIGDLVKAGDLIAELDDRDLRARIVQAEGEVRAAEARLALVRRGAREEELAQARMGVQDAAATHALAETQLRRQSELFARGLLPRDDVDVATRNLDTATARLRSAEAQLALLQRKFLPEDVQVAEGQVAQARGNLEVVRTQLSYARLTAPIAGIIASVSTQEGEAISAGLQAPTFVTLVDLTRLQADAFVDETDIGKVAPGQPAVLTVDAFPDREFKGKVTAILPKASIQQNVVYYDTVIALEPAGGLLRPDMTANVTILVGERRGRLVVPNQAIRREDGEKVVYVLVGGKGQRRVVKTGWKDGRYTEVLDGLREGERVLIGAPPA